MRPTARAMASTRQRPRVPARSSLPLRSCLRASFAPAPLTKTPRPSPRRPRRTRSRRCGCAPPCSPAHGRRHGSRPLRARPARCASASTRPRPPRPASAPHRPVRNAKTRWAPRRVCRAAPRGRGDRPWAKAARHSPPRSAPRGQDQRASAPSPRRPDWPSEVGSERQRASPAPRHPPCQRQSPKPPIRCDGRRRSRRQRP